MTPDLVTVGIPAYNAARWLPETLESVLAQTYPHIEIIVVDDGSKDETESVVRGFAPRVRYIRQANSGPAATRNKAIRAGSGEFIALLDADDVFEPDKIERQVAVMKQAHDVGLVFCDYRPFGTPVPYRTGLERGPVLRTIPKRPIGGNAYVLESENLFMELMKDLFPWTSSLMIRRSAFERTGGFEETLKHVAEDWLLCLRLSKYGKFAYIDECLVHRREHDGSLSRQGHDERSQVAALARLVEWPELTGEEREAARRRLVEALFGLGHLEFWQGDLDSARKRFLRYMEETASSTAIAGLGTRRRKAMCYLLASRLPPALVKSIASVRGWTHDDVRHQ